MPSGMALRLQIQPSALKSTARRAYSWGFSASGRKSPSGSEPDDKLRISDRRQAPKAMPVGWSLRSTS